MTRQISNNRIPILGETYKDSQPPPEEPTWWWQWRCRSRCRGSWCSRRAREPGPSAASRDRTDSWTPCYWSPKYLSAPAAEEAQCLWRDKGQRLMYRYWTGTEKNEQINRDRQTGSEKRSRVNMLGMSKMLQYSRLQCRFMWIKSWIWREAAPGCECRCVFTHNPLK